MIRQDTIAALGTAPGRSGITIVRVSGDRAEALLTALFTPERTFETHRMEYGHIQYAGELIDECMAVLMRAPKSYTREDVAEIYLHGGDWTAEKTLQALFALGARPAEPGEFTRRAFENGRIDLSRAEAVMQLISASGERGAKAALRQLEGGASAFIKDAQGTLLSLLSGVAAALDFPDEVDEQQTAREVAEGARAVARTLLTACDERAAKLLSTGLTTVLCGLPNVGKSSLLNLLLSSERAIVSDTPGTTRDIVSGTLYVDGVRVELHDTAGIRESGEAVERIGVQRSMRAIQTADCALLVLDATRAPREEEQALMLSLGDTPHGIVLNKRDLSPTVSDEALIAQFLSACAPDARARAEALHASGALLTLSARNGEGLAGLRQLLSAFVRTPQDTILVNARHIQLARAAAAQLTEAADALESGVSLDVIDVLLQGALQTLGAITGEDVTERLLDDIFSQFCVGK